MCIYISYLYIFVGCRMSLFFFSRFQGRETLLQSQSWTHLMKVDGSIMLGEASNVEATEADPKQDKQETRWRSVFESFSLNQWGTAMPQDLTRWRLDRCFFFSDEIFCRGNAFQIAHPGPWDSVWSWIVVVVYGWARYCVWRVLLSQMLQSDVECMDAGLKKLVKPCGSL